MKTMKRSKGILIILIAIVLVYVPTTVATAGAVSSNTSVVIKAGSGKTNPEIPILPATGQ